MYLLRNTSFSEILLFTSAYWWTYPVTYWTEYPCWPHSRWEK